MPSRLYHPTYGPRARPYRRVRDVRRSGFAKDFLDIRARDQCDPATFNAANDTTLLRLEYRQCDACSSGGVPNGGHHA
jgi:hypothetical protein